VAASKRDRQTDSGQPHRRTCGNTGRQQGTRKADRKEGRQAGRQAGRPGLWGAINRRTRSWRDTHSLCQCLSLFITATTGL
jgi:hypothetical protein